MEGHMAQRHSGTNEIGKHWKMWERAEGVYRRKQEGSMVKMSHVFSAARDL